jgi:hypothetical protein
MSDHGCGDTADDVAHQAAPAVRQGRRQAIDSMLAGWQFEEVRDLARMIAKLNVALFDSVTE